jgi:ssDNA-binding Zn-finger/Zn-ribbon topoisomerase 1
MSEKQKCPVCGEKLVVSKDAAKGNFMVCSKVDKDSFDKAEDVEHYRKSLYKVGD